jgi:hypothetical protein
MKRKIHKCPSMVRDTDRWRFPVNMQVAGLSGFKKGEEFLD